jgi:hypothetical protein
MRAFTVLSTLACAAVSFAIPLDIPQVADGTVGTVKNIASSGLDQVKEFDNGLHGWFQGVEVDDVVPVARGLDVAGVQDKVHNLAQEATNKAEVISRDEQPDTVPDIIEDLVEQLKPLLDQLGTRLFFPCACIVFLIDSTSFLIYSFP